MFPSKGNSGFGQQQQYGAQQAYGQMSGTDYYGNSAGASDLASQRLLASRQASLHGAQEADASAYRSHPSQVPQYGGPYASVYGSSAIGAQQSGGLANKAAGSSDVHGKAAFAATHPEANYSSLPHNSGLMANTDAFAGASNLGFRQREDQFPIAKGPGYASLDKSHYADHAGSYIGREFPNDLSRRYTDVRLDHLSKVDMRDNADQVSLLRQQQMLKAQSMVSSSDVRQADYLSAAAAPVRRGLQDFSAYGGGMDAGARGSSVLGATPYGGQSSAIEGALRRNADDYMFGQGSSSGIYGVGLPPGRDYGTNKGLRDYEPDYQGSVMAHRHSSFGASLGDERKDDKHALRRELDPREEDRHRDLIRERERESDREERDRERERERLRVRERGRERERNREERDHLLERRDRERDRERKRAAELKRERTPRATKDRPRSSLLKDERPPLRVTPLKENAHRHLSPVKEKRRGIYICKVFSSCLVDMERDFLALSKRFPRLSISSEFSKVVINWPKGIMNLSMYTPVSFVHDFVEEDIKVEDNVSSPQTKELLKSSHRNTVWNAKVILMSGVGKDALDELCSDKNSSGKVTQFNSILKFAVIKKDISFMAIGGPWSSTKDGGDPSSDDSSLIQTAIRHTKDLTSLDLRNCLHWNRFLEIEYNRVDKDGLFSHKEITVLFVPNLLECLPSVKLWQSQWLDHQKDVEAIERNLHEKHEKKSSKPDIEEGRKGLVVDSKKDEKCSGNVEDIAQIDGDSKMDMNDMLSENKLDGKQVSVETEPKVNVEKHQKGVSDTDVENHGEASVLLAENQSSEMVIKKIVKEETGGSLESMGALVVTTDELPSVNNESSAAPVMVKTFIRKRIVRKLSAESPKIANEVTDNAVVKAENTESSSKLIDTITSSIPELSENTQKVDLKPEIINMLETDETTEVQETVVKTSGKKKIIKRVIKRKIIRVDKTNSSTNEDLVKDGENIKDSVKDQGLNSDDKLVAETSENKTGDTSKKHISNETNMKESAADNKTGDASKNIKSTEANTNETGSENKTGDMPKKLSSNEPNLNEKGSKKGNNEDEKRLKEAVESEHPKNNDSKKDGRGGEKESARDVKEKLRNSKHDLKVNGSTEIKEKSKTKEPPKQPGLFLKTKCPKGSKIRSVSSSLNSLLNYNEKDIQESSFEVSLFAESFCEMLHYEMGCRLLSFFEKLHLRATIKNNLRKRERDEQGAKVDDKESSIVKRQKIGKDSPVEAEVVKSEVPDNSNPSSDIKVSECANMVEEVEEKSVNNELDNIMEEEDPEEVVEDNQEDDDAPMLDAASEDGGKQVKSVSEAQSKNVTSEDEEGKKASNSKQDIKTKDVEDKSGKEEKKKDKEIESPKEVDVDKELLQAFSFFDQNGAGYVKVEDLRAILHSLGKLLSFREVKDLVHSALLESHSARVDNRVFYKKLVRIFF